MTLPLVRPQAYDQAVLDDAEAVLRDGALNDHLPGVQALREAWTAHRELLLLAASHPMALPARSEVPRVVRHRQPREVALPSKAERCPASDPVKGPCVKDRHPVTGRGGGHSFFNTAQRRAETVIPEQRSAPPRYFDEVG